MGNLQRYIEDSPDLLAPFRNRNWMQQYAGDLVNPTSCENRNVIGGSLSLNAAQPLPPDKPPSRLAGKIRIRQTRWTWNNPDATPDQVLSKFQALNADFAIFQLEQAPTTGTLHYQGYTHWPKPIALGTVNSMFPHVHFMKCDASVKDNVDYASKEETRVDGPWSFGEIPAGQGHRGDLRAIADRAIELGSFNSIVREMPDAVLKYGRGLQTLLRYSTKPPTFRDVKVLLYYGKTGTGKTFKALTDYPNAYIKNSGKWWDNYTGENVVVWDDFSGAASQMTLVETLRALDKYRYQCEVKGGFEWLTADTIIVTSNLHPKAWYKWEGREDQYYALCRRFTEIYWFRGRDNYTLVDQDHYDSWLFDCCSWGYEGPQPGL